MAKPRKPKSRRLSRKDQEKKRRAEEQKAAAAARKEEEPKYSRPENGDVEACRQRVAAGMLCFCKKRCHCRECQEGKERKCDLEMVKEEGSCFYGCYKCPDHLPCYQA